MTRVGGTLHKDVGIFILSRSLLLKMGYVSDESCTENRKSKHTFYVQHFFFENPAVCKKNMVEPDG